jgi:hypothetical protein
MWCNIICEQPVIKNYWDFGFCPLSEVLNISKNTTFRKLDVLPSSGDGMETHALLGVLERADFGHWIGPRRGRHGQWTASHPTQGTNKRLRRMSSSGI